MQRIITGIIILGVIILFATYRTESKANQPTIPEDAVRLRIIANSNASVDQSIKLEIRDRIITHLTPKLQTVDNYEDARIAIYYEVDAINEIVSEVLDENELDIDYYVDYGKTHFPQKAYDDQVYQAGEYESIYVVLGEGKGDNWWCVLFPPLCLVDVSDEESDIANFKDVEYKFYIIEKLKELFSHK